MKKLSSLLIVMLLVSTFLSSFVLADEKNSDALKLVALGDSITFGSGLEQGAKPFPSLIGDGNLEVTNLGVPGATSSDLVKSLGAASESLLNADVVTLTIGGNDLLQNEMIATILQTQEIQVPEEQLYAEVHNIVTTYTQNLQTIVAGIRQHTTAPIVLYTIYNPFGPSEDPFAQNLHILAEQIVTSMNSGIQAVSGPSGSLVANAYASFANNQSALMASDRIHPNASGHQTLASLADQLLADLLTPPAPPEEEEEPVAEEPVDEKPIEEPPVDEPSVEKPILVALGDSITYGLYLEFDVTKPSTLAFPNLIGKGKHEVINLGVPGLTSSQLLELLKSNPDYTVALENTELITINIGNNDLLKAAGIAEAIQAGQPIVPTEELQQKLDEASVQMAHNLHAIMEILRQQTDAPIILYNLYNPFGESEDEFAHSLHLLGEQIIPAVNNQIITPVALQAGAFVADAYTAFAGKQSTYITHDFVHPNALGHEALAVAGDAALRGVEPIEEPVTEEPVDEEPIKEKPVTEEPEKENPVPVTPIKKDPVKKDPVKKDSVQKPVTEKKQESDPIGKKLPQTATSMYNYLAIGAALFILGVTLLFVAHRRQKVAENIV
ncbi:GDSL-type esterase/lipase family protein [Halalkalibacter flavus]|uniref:GDSL-type esterase/lipase family protein n=1 Tax=Halalkalibacter flavus TaxID=3090668 RepID=UPI002FC629DF